MLPNSNTPKRPLGKHPLFGWRGLLLVIVVMLFVSRCSSGPSDTPVAEAGDTAAPAAVVEPTPEPTAVPPTPTPKTEVGAAEEIRSVGVCRDAMREQLRSPSEADFPWMADKTFYVEGRKVKVRDHVDAPNAFGTPVRTNYTCTVQFSEDFQTDEIVEFYVLD